MHKWMLGSLRLLPVAGLLAAGLAAGPDAPAAASQASGTWAKTGSMTTPRQGQTATLLGGGQVLVISGGSAGAELYNPATGKWTATRSPAAPASGYTTTLLQNGQVLLAGGDQDGTAATTTSSAELYNPATGTWAATGSMTTARAGHTATLLQNGQVLVAGGESGSTANAGSTAELYNPGTGTWATTGDLSVPRTDALAGLLPNGQVLVVCGAPPGYVRCEAELYNPATGTWAQDGAASPSAERDFSATMLTNGQVLISGGLNGTYPAKVHVSSTATLFDPATGTATATATATGSMTIPRAFHTLTALQNGQVLAAGGETQNNVGKFSTTASAELFTP